VSVCKIKYKNLNVLMFFQNTPSTNIIIYIFVGDIY